MLSPAYSPGFPHLLEKLASGLPAPAALAAAWSTTPAAIERDVRARLAHPPPPTPLPPVPAGAEIRTGPVTPFASPLLLADLRLANGELARAESLYRALLSDHPAAPELHAALGAIALQRGDTSAATASWARAIDLGIADPDLCYRYSILADERGLNIRPALERALALRPDFDDARFKLALLESNAGHTEAAVAHLRAMREISPARAFFWWTTLASALLDLNRRDEARHAAVQARAHAETPDQRDRAAELEWFADTELAVQVDGQKFRTVRVPVAAPRNPFIEPGDRPERAETILREIQCTDSAITLLVDSPAGPSLSSVPDPSKVELRNAGAVAFEFTCGPQSPRPVLVEYAASTLVLRGLTLH